MKPEFEGLVAIVTGGASGIGAAAASVLRSRGASVAILDRFGVPGDARDYYTCDLRDSPAVKEAVRQIEADFGGIDVLVNNAGVGAVGNIAANTDEEWHEVFDINVVGLVRVTRAALPALERSPSASIVNTCSVAASIGLQERALYTATKGAVAALTLAMAADHLKAGVRVNAVLPGTADTPWVARLLDQAPDPVAAAEVLRRRQPIGRLVTADEVANAIAYLASPLTASTTGTLLAVDGGMAGLRVN